MLGRIISNYQQSSAGSYHHHLPTAITRYHQLPAAISYRQQPATTLSSNQQSSATCNNTASSSCQQQRAAAVSIQQFAPESRPTMTCTTTHDARTTRDHTTCATHVPTRTDDTIEISLSADYIFQYTTRRVLDYTYTTTNVAPCHVWSRSINACRACNNRLTPTPAFHRNRYQHTRQCTIARIASFVGIQCISSHCIVSPS